MALSDEIEEKQRRVNALLKREGFDALLLSTSAGFAWFSGGGDCHVNIAEETGVGALLVRPDSTTLLTNNVERGRLLEEELAGCGFQDHASLWTEDALPDALQRLAPNEKIAADVPLPGVTPRPEAIAALRRSLTQAEVERYRALGRDVGEAIGEAAGQVEPGMTEHEAAAILAGHHFRRGAVPIVVLVAADERILKYRHPVPTDNEIQRCVLLVVCGRRHGLIVSATRIVHFGQLPEELRRKHDAVTAIDAAFVGASRIGTPISDVFKAGLDAYAEHGYPEEWKLHHQGGPTGYAARDFRATLETTDAVEPNQAFAWNPSITGTKSEDTIIVTSDGPEIISASPSFPTIEGRAQDATFPRADILVR